MTLSIRSLVLFLFIVSSLASNKMSSVFWALFMIISVLVMMSELIGFVEGLIFKLAYRKGFKEKSSDVVDIRKIRENLERKEKQIRL